MNKALLFVTLMVAFLAMFAQAERPHFNPMLKFKCMKQATEEACVKATGCAFVQGKCRVARKHAPTPRPQPRPQPKPVAVDAESLIQLNEAAEESLTGCIQVCKTVKGINICGQYCSLSDEAESLSEGIQEAMTIEPSDLQGCITVTKNGMTFQYCTLSESLQAAELAENVEDLYLEESNLQGCISVCKRGTCATYCTLTEQAEEAPAQLQGFGKSVKKMAKKAGRAARHMDWEIVV